MKTTSTLTRGFLILAALQASACSSDDTPATNPGAACGINDAAKVNSITLKSGDPGCPNLTPNELNAADDAGGDCEGVVNTSACTISFGCMMTDMDGTVTTVNGVLGKSGSGVAGDLTVGVALPDGTSLTCTYSIKAG